MNLIFNHIRKTVKGAEGMLDEIYHVVKGKQQGIKIPRKPLSGARWRVIPEDVAGCVRRLTLLTILGI